MKWDCLKEGRLVKPDPILRAALWTSVPFNLLAAAMLAFPESPLGQIAGLSTPVPLVYRVVLAYFVALFGAAYAWMAWQPTTNRPLIALSAIGKSGVFVLMLILWFLGEVPVQTLLLTIGDLLLAGVFVWRMNRESV
jgi:hypothetical protein